MALQAVCVLQMACNFCRVGIVVIILVVVSVFCLKIKMPALVLIGLHATSRAAK